jgi:gallate dioxygenase
MTGLATAIYKNQAVRPMADETAAYLNHVHHQLTGVERLEGTYPFTLETSVRAYRLNRFLHRMIEPAHRQRFLADPEEAFAESQLTEQERDMVRRRDWRAMIHYGVIFFMLEKLGAVVRVSNLPIYAAMCGQTLEEFQKTRNAPGALYSVAGRTPKPWDGQSRVAKALRCIGRAGSARARGVLPAAA